MVANRFRQDLRVNLPPDVWEKATLSVSPAGDLQTVDGGEKLAVQLMRAVVNDEVLSQGLLNTKSLNTRSLNVLMNLVLRNFRQNQIDEVKRSDPDFSGYSVYRKASGTNDQYDKVSTRIVDWKFIDENLENGTEYDYGFTKTYRKVFETTFSEKMSATPSQFSNKQLIVIGREVAAIPSNRQVTFYFDANRNFKGSELLEKVVSIDVQRPGDEPRRIVINVVVQDLRGNQLDLSVRRNFATK